jgi:hypothetical protein
MFDYVHKLFRVIYSPMFVLGVAFTGFFNLACLKDHCWGEVPEPKKFTEPDLAGFG